MLRIGGEHGADGFVQRVGHPGGFVNQEEADRGEASDRVFVAGESDDSRVVGEQERHVVVSVSFAADFQISQECFGFSEEFGGLAGGGGDYQGEGAWMVNGVVDRFEGGYGGLSPLASTVDDAAADVGVEHLRLIGIGVEVELRFREVDRVEMIGYFVESHCVGHG
jgi:hypothetical protein